MGEGKAGRRSTSAGAKVSLQVGQPFNPFGLFNGIFIPDALSRATGVSPGAKIAYGRLTRYAGSDGNCYPSVPTLAIEIGSSVRQTQRYLTELESVELLRRTARMGGSGQTSNSYVFLWHSLLELGLTKKGLEGVTDMTPEGVTDLSPKDSQTEDSQNIDLDYPSTNRKRRDSRPDLSEVSSTCKQYCRLREELADYMATMNDERVYPPDRLVVDVMDAAAGFTEDEVIQCLRHLKSRRRLLPGTRHGPRSFSWFKTVVADYFQQKSHQRAVYASTTVEWNLRNGKGLSKQEFDYMTDAIDEERIK
jgi:hypothetical protein